MPRIGIIIQARTGSTRLPGKVILPFHGNKSILDVILEKILVFKNRFPIILATSTKENDQVLKYYSDKYGIEFFVGSESNVLERFYMAGQAHNLDAIVRVCSDNPFLEIEYLNNLLFLYDNHEGLDYCSYKTAEGIPVIKSHWGLFSEIVTVSALRRTLEATEDVFYQEHVTNYIYGHPKKFNVKLFNAPELVFKREDFRFTVDNEIDFENMSTLYSLSKKNNWDLENVIAEIDRNESLKSSMINNINIYKK
ncbi:hypothetical protein J8L85_03135 [Maribacter sp. MMG018]|uniref:cytidylyltransferase domain-containing protein n=1 Tax=Maribacter sp. MMG018 TaxID=2822688 RepID=UPI001B37BA9B|nr:hypothetical protein [Maribacter sp. MMG018]MBQ4913415.1 hypothetical protein [Maribacter sp. MMG018]